MEGPQVDVRVGISPFDFRSSVADWMNSSTSLSKVMFPPSGYRWVMKKFTQSTSRAGIRFSRRTAIAAAASIRSSRSIDACRPPSVRSLRQSALSLVSFVHGLDNAPFAWSDLVYGVNKPSPVWEFLKWGPVFHFG